MYLSTILSISDLQASATELASNPHTIPTPGNGLIKSHYLFKCVAIKLYSNTCRWFWCPWFSVYIGDRMSQLFGCTPDFRVNQIHQRQTRQTNIKMCFNGDTFSPNR